MSRVAVPLQRANLWLAAPTRERPEQLERARLEGCRGFGVLGTPVGSRGPRARDGSHDRRRRIAAATAATADRHRCSPGPYLQWLEPERVGTRTDDAAQQEVE